MDRWNDELESLFRSYKAALPDPDASANFMPELWQKIEARHSLLIRLKKLTQVFVAAASALCLLFGMVLAVPRAGNGDLAGSYVDILAQSNPPDSLAVLGIVPHEANDIQ